jgi:hypothetical protein
MYQKYIKNLNLFYVKLRFLKRVQCIFTPEVSFLFTSNLIMDNVWDFTIRYTQIQI